MAGYDGNPYDTDRGCRRECETNAECSDKLACVQYKCVNPCIGICGEYAICQVDNHVPICTCPAGYSGDPFFQCREILVLRKSNTDLVNSPTNCFVDNTLKTFSSVAPPRNEYPCNPSPCGPNSNCREHNSQAVCTCQPNYIGSPPQCRPECVVSSECPTEKACINNRCADPCPHTCGIGSVCHTNNHNPICACPSGYTGDPFTQCSLFRKSI